LRNTIGLLGAAAVAGCMVLSPLEPVPEESASTAGRETSGGHGGNAALGGFGGSIGGAGAAGEAGASVAGASDAGSSSLSCTTNAECSRRNFDEPHRCRPDGTCVQLATEACPLVYGKPDDDNAVYIGAFATREGVNLADSTTVFTYRLALDELNGDGVEGLPGGPGRRRRPLVLIVCDNEESAFEATMEHLANEVQVPGILATLDTAPLVRAFDEYGGDRIFFLSPFGGSRELSSKVDQGLIWSMLGQPSDLAGVYATLLERLEVYLKAAFPIETLRVAAVRTTDAFSTELADAVLPALRLNGDDANAALEAETLLPLTLRPEDAEANVTAITTALHEFKPHVILSLANEVFVANTGILRFVEESWGAVNPGQPRPFYVLSPKNFDRVQQTVGPIIEAQMEVNELAHQRFLVIAPAPAEDRSLYNNFLVRLATAYPRARPEAENLYDAFYFMTYAMYGAGSVAELTGPGIARGMLRLLSGDPIREIDVGPATIGDVFNALGSPSSTIRLMGTLGPPEFDTVIGARIGSGSVSCFDSRATLREHTLRYDRETEALVGDFSPCYAGF